MRPPVLRESSLPLPCGQQIGGGRMTPHGREGMVLKMAD
ncbi:Hypothetical protein ETEE_0796 [Edwardsiella anguillarum ET080813]|uniref:Uncharacterized protein n=1 Tax=Edwardsiella anguillarum ET080813 TaxID=667120 RepID=A0A076LKC6_9GAMM|nr:Hypothetical protein ETEE_0796 [Edwardsiella anguillarum ET080813]